MRSLLLLTTLAAVSVAVVVKLLPDEASATPALRPAQEIVSISIDGGRGLPQAALRARLESAPGQLVDEQRLARDRAALADELEARGYLAATVSEPSVTFGKAGGAYLVFEVERGELFHLRSITITGPRRREAGVVTLSPGDEAARARIEQARQALRATLERYARTSGPVAVDVVLHTDVRAAALDVELVTH